MSKKVDSLFFPAEAAAQVKETCRKLRHRLAGYKRQKLHTVTVGELRDLQRVLFKIMRKVLSLVEDNNRLKNANMTLGLKVRLLEEENDRIRQRHSGD